MLLSTKNHKQRIEKYITEAEQQGAKILVDGRNTKVEGKENGTYVGPTVIDYVTPDMSVATEEIFGPVISIMRTKTVDEALAIENANPYGNAASVFTQNGGMARYIIDKASAGMIGVNVGVPVPREPFSFGGWNESKFGVGDITGKSSIEFWTKLKKSHHEMESGSGSELDELRNNFYSANSSLENLKLEITNCDLNSITSMPSKKKNNKSIVADEKSQKNLCYREQKVMLDLIWLIYMR